MIPSRAVRQRMSIPLLVLFSALCLSAEVVWQDVASRVIHNTPVGDDLLAGEVARDNQSDDAIYFKVHVDPLSDVASEEYDAAFQLFEKGEPRLAVGNAPEAWGYSVHHAAETGPDNKRPGELNLRSSQPEAGPLGAFKTYELPRINKGRTLVFKVQFVPGGDDLVTVWLSPNLGNGATEENQPEALTTKFKANAAFNEIRLNHQGGGNGWIFSDMAVATSFQDFIIVRFWQTWWFTALSIAGLLAAVVLAARIIEKRKYQLRLQLAERENAVERERARIAQDLHDELGSSLTRLAMMTDSLRELKNDPAQIESRAARISQTSTETVRALEEIVWALRPGSDTLQSLVEYIAHFAQELFEGSTARCRLDLPDNLPDHPLPPNMRHNIFLIVKEALTNALKHSGATEIQVHAKADGQTLELVVSDNGRGFDEPAATAEQTRNGLGNMRRRAEQMSGQLSFTSNNRSGTQVTLVVQLPGIATNANA